MIFAVALILCSSCFNVSFSILFCFNVRKGSKADASWDAEVAQKEGCRRCMYVRLTGTGSEGVSALAAIQGEGTSRPSEGGERVGACHLSPCCLPLN